MLLEYTKMNIKKTALSTLAGLMVSFIPVSNVLAQATQVCFGANITRVGSTGPVPPNSGYRIEVEGGTCSFAPFTPFFLDDNIGSSGLAIVLTAFALNKTVTLVLPNPAPNNSLVFKVHVDE